MNKELEKYCTMLDNIDFQYFDSYQSYYKSLPIETRASVIANNVELFTKKFGKPIFLFPLFGYKISTWKVGYQDRDYYLFSHKERGTSYEATKDCREEEVIEFFTNIILPLFNKTELPKIEPNELSITKSPQVV